MSLKLVHRPDSKFLWIVGTVRGQRVRESSGTDDPRLAEEARAARESAAYREAVHGPVRGSTSFAAAALSYLKAGGPHATPTQTKVGRLVRHFGPKVTCADVNQVRLDQACDALLRPGSAPATRLREIITPARAVLSHAARRGWCDVPPFDIAATPPAKTEWLTPAEMDRLISGAAPHLRPLLTFLAATGARMGEALSLDWQDVDLTHARALLRDTKNGADRPVDLCPRALLALADLTHRDGAVFRTRGKRVKNVSVPGEPYAERKEQGGGQIKTGWASALSKAGITKPVTPHSLRHTWASWHYAEHRDLLLLRFVGGWSSVTLVERYAHIVPATLGDEIKAWRGAAADTILTRHFPGVAAEAAKSLEGMVLLEGIELSTSPLPRECSTTELQQPDLHGGGLGSLRGDRVQGLIDMRLRESAA